jgi:transposase
MSKPDATLAELQAWLIAEHDVKVSAGCLWKRLRHLGLTLKKSHCAPLNKIAPISPKPARSGDRANPISTRNVVFLDETGAKTNMVRLYGRAPRGQRLFAPVPYGHWMTTTFVAALRHDEITAPCVFDGPMNGASFRTYVEHFLAPVLRQGDIVVMDNLASHKVKGVKEAIEQAGATVRYLPAYSPDLNPIEQAFAKLKAALRKTAARTFATLVEAIADALGTFTPEECENYIVNSGYRRQS